MTRFNLTPRGLTQTIVALSLVATVSLVGCGTDVATAPDFVAIENDDGGASEGELPLPSRRDGIDSPIGLELASISANGAVLTWLAPATSGLVAMIDLNGVRIGEVSADAGAFTDNLAKRPGHYHYAVCFAQGKKTGGMKVVDGEVMAVPDDGGRNDKDPEDGR